MNMMGGGNMMPSETINARMPPTSALGALGLNEAPTIGTLNSGGDGEAQI